VHGLARRQRLDGAVEADAHDLHLGGLLRRGHDDGVGALALGHLERRDDGHAAGASDQQPLLAGEAAGHLERVGVGDGDDLVGDLGVVGARPEVLADTLHQVRAARAAGVDRALGVGADDLDPTAGDLLEVAADAGDRAAGAHAGDEVRDACEAGPAGLEYWSGFQAFGVSRTRRSETL
jgi:hypothetical protein